MKTLLCCLFVGCGLSAVALVAAADKKPGEDGWTATFAVEKGELVSVGRNPYFSLEPGHQSTLEGGDERLVITVLHETKVVDGVETRIVEERETKGGKLVEVSRNYFAISKVTNSVFYFGEEVDIYKNGKIASHEGAWESGKNGAKFGLLMPGQILLKGKHYQEVAPDVAMDRAEIQSDSETVTTHAGEFKNCLKVEETTPLERDISYKYYAPGVGLIQDGDLKFVKQGKVDPPKK